MMTQQERNRGKLYGAFAFASVIVACYAHYFFVRRVNAEGWQVLLSFGLGGVYAAFAILANCWSESANLGPKFAYFAVLCAILTALLIVTPMHQGYFGIIVLPAVSQAIFDLKWK